MKIYPHFLCPIGWCYPAAGPVVLGGAQPPPHGPPRAALGRPLGPPRRVLRPPGVHLSGHLSGARRPPGPHTAQPSGVLPLRAARGRTPGAAATWRPRGHRWVGLDTRQYDARKTMT
eukprot:4808377-Pyramimonas_sp.AAC.1